MRIAKDRPVGEDKRKKPIVEKKVVQSVSNTTKISPDALDTSAVQSTFKKGGSVKKHYEDNPQDFMGKSCIRFKKFDKIPYELIGELTGKISLEEWKSTYQKYLERPVEKKK